MKKHSTFSCIRSIYHFGAERIASTDEPNPSTGWKGTSGLKSTSGVKGVAGLKNMASGKGLVHGKAEAGFSTIRAKAGFSTTKAVQAWADLRSGGFLNAGAVFPSQKAKAGFSTIKAVQAWADLRSGGFLNAVAVFPSQKAKAGFPSIRASSVWFAFPKRHFLWRRRAVAGVSRFAPALSFGRCLLLAVCVLMAGSSCSQAKRWRPSVATHHKAATHDTLRTSRLKYDSIYIDHTLFQNRSHDTLLIRDTKTEYRYCLLHDTLRLHTTDTLLQTVVTERELPSPKSQNLSRTLLWPTRTLPSSKTLRWLHLLRWLRIGFKTLLAVVIAILVARQLYRLKRKRKL